MHVSKNPHTVHTYVIHSYWFHCVCMFHIPIINKQTHHNQTQTSITQYTNNIEL